jgi:uncharacterized protein YndB with AHSA1/START domain
MTQVSKIHWPDRYHPDNVPVHVRNELDMAASPEQVWSWLIRATRWPEWYSNAANVEIVDGGGPDLTDGARFRWKTFDVTITSTVREFVPFERIAWDAQAFGLDVYHAWLLQPSGTGCLVITEESQHGLLARLGKLAMPGRMYKYHQLWLEALANKARGGPCV